MNTNDASTTITRNAAVAERGAQNGPEQATSTKKAPKKGSKAAAKKEGKPSSRKASKAEAKPAPKKASKTSDSQPREGSKKQIVLDLLRRKDGATMGEIAKATAWRNHSIRGFISGQVSKRMGLVVESAKNQAGDRTYKIVGK